MTNSNDRFDRIDDNLNFLIESGGLVTKTGLVIPTEVRPTCSALALKAWRSIEGKNLSYRRSDDKIWAEWGSPEGKHLIDRLEQTKFYVKALAELPNLVLRHFRVKKIKTNTTKPNEEFICKRQQLTHKIQSQWLDYFLLHNQTVLLELKSADKKLLKPKSKLSRRSFECIKELWDKSYCDQNKTCHWVLHFDSPAHLWFAVEAHWCEVNMYQSMEPGNKTAATSKEEIYKEVRKCAFDMRESADKFEIDVNGDKEIEEIDPYAATQVTAYEMSRPINNISTRASYHSFLGAWAGDASHTQRKGLKRVYTDSQKRVIVTGKN